MRKKVLWGVSALILAFVILFVAVSFVLRPQRSKPTSKVETVWPESPAFTLQSEAFADGQPIPSRYTCQGDNVSPPLMWSEPPPGTRAFALIMDDPDAPLGVWVHWVVYNIPPETRALPTAFQPSEESSVRFAKNSWGKKEYGGPCPPSGTHRYVFQLYALDMALTQEIADKAALLQAMEGHVLAYSELVGVYSKR